MEESRLLRWRSLSGVQNAGEATFEPAEEEGAGLTRVSLSMTYTLPDVAGPLIETSVAQRFVYRTMLSTMERFREALEAEAAAEEEEDVGGVKTTVPR